jgi:putative acetyltransferase
MTTPEPLQWDIIAADATSAEAALLIAQLSAELASLYDHADDGSGHFDPKDVGVPRSVFLIGRLHGQAVACGAIRPLVSDVCEVKRMYVAPDARGRGFSRLILSALEVSAREMGYLALWLETGDRQPAAISLYESAGYRRIAPFGIYVGSERSICFEKRLTELIDTPD